MSHPSVLKHGLAGALCLVAVPVLAQVNSPQAQALLLQAVEEAYRAEGCVVRYNDDDDIIAFFDAMDVIAERKFKAAGLVLPPGADARDAAFLPVFSRLFDEGLIVSESNGAVERFPSACETD
ncbi:MAG: hypothetical protein AAGA87_04225 [Pseudomonadota bacterium]